MSTTSFLTFDPSQPLSHLDYYPIEADNTHSSTQEETELAELLKALFELYSALAAYLSHQLESLHASQIRLLQQTCSNLQRKEEDQGLLFLLFSVSAERAYFSTPQRRGVLTTRLALVKSNLRTFLSNISQAFQTFLGFSSATSSLSSSSAATNSTNTLLAVTIPEDLTRIDREGLSAQLQIDQASELSQLNGLLQDAFELFQDVAAMKFKYKTCLDSINSQQIQKFKSNHQELEDKNGRSSLLSASAGETVKLKLIEIVDPTEKGRQSILKFLAALEVAAQELHGGITSTGDGGDAD
ncbi:hypothetical protein JCM3765_007264 [Sporobolomyces pararoseus]